MVGLSQLVVLSLGHMNMAVGRMAAMSAFAMGLSYKLFGLPLIVDLLIGLAVGAGLGALAGLIRSWHRRPARKAARSAGVVVKGRSSDMGGAMLA